ncbi:spermidine/putrescine import ATP-binding protein potA [Actinoplanes sp. SE50]|uniref:ABC transporter ATP-binding protein n=1 Tax=unclassified Actinoplanes TaxID=2626549 RepID=UPI00023EC600|nr:MULTISPECIES: ATP-binding cassette domain-containing protein [unclassified Actinoplanes]AEV84177.1 Spermidine/putrescine import ATP-binding protein potA [Actinoplanes sp. SE50/110]ATO82569.1 spermidine/putrescine import ATP-binding protein potA [Actinoplanes sp. SE50]SLL99976.1 hypothetical protein ACSP50_3208 [Actinoplanes sp. SE50/110]
MTDIPFRAENVTKRFRRTTAVDAVTWAPRAGRVTALVGLNGAGKSTLLRMLAGLIRPTSGTVTRHRPLSAMIEAPALHAGLSARRNLEMHRILTGAGRARLAEVAELAQVTEVLDRRAGALSQGYRQRLAIAVALLGAPAALLLDEPANALDPEAVVHLRHLVRTVAAQGTAVVVSSHQLRELDGVADALTLLHRGRIRYDGPFGDFVGPARLRVRASDRDRLTRALHDDGLTAQPGGDHLWITPGRPGPDRTASRVFAAAARAGVTLVELSHVAPTLEEAFHQTIAEVRR